MAKYRHQLPQLSGDLFLTDGGIETTLIFHHGFELPYFAAFDLLKDSNGRDALRRYFYEYVSIAREHQTGFVLESVTWRASEDWGAKLGYSAADMSGVNRQAIEMLCDIRDEYETAKTPMVVSGCIGPRGDGYNPASLMSESEAEQYHTLQARAFNEADADMVTAITMTHVEEAIGVTRAAKSAGMPVAISFTVETNGALPSGQSLQDAIEQLDTSTNNGPAYYMINCAHPTHFENTLATGKPWVERIRGIRANASKMSHAELDEAEELDDGNPLELGADFRTLRNRFGQLNVLGGCCGTDHRHIEQIVRACA